jgi:hypothetical protein
MLGVKKTKFIHTLIDMLELDTSESVRTMVSLKNYFQILNLKYLSLLKLKVLKALLHLAPNNPKVVQAFNNLEKNSKIYQ